MEYCVEFPVLYNRSLLVSYFVYSSKYMTISISQFISLPTLPPITMFVFYTYNSISVLYISSFVQGLFFIHFIS